MSWINNALKFAEYNRPKNAPPSDLALLAADCPAPKRASNLPLILLIVAAMSLSGSMTWAWFRANNAEMKVRARSYNSAVNPVSEPQPAVTAPVTPEIKPVAAAADPDLEKKLVAEAATGVSVAPETPKPEPTVFKLQGIVYNPGRSSAVINGKTVYAGDRVADGHVLSIAKDTAVIVTASGQTNVLDLE